MSSVKELAKEVFEGRQAIAETIKVNPIMREVAAKYVKQLLNIFKVSNEQKKTAIWIWQLQLTLDESSENLFISFAIEKGGNARFYDRSFLATEISGCIVKGKNDELLKAINEIQIPTPTFDSLCDYCKENLTEYFNVKIVEGNKLILELKDTICENENSEN